MREISFDCGVQTYGYVGFYSFAIEIRVVRYRHTVGRGRRGLSAAGFRASPDQFPNSKIVCYRTNMFSIRFGIVSKKQQPSRAKVYEKSG